MGLSCRWSALIVVQAILIAVQLGSYCAAWDGDASHYVNPAVCSVNSHYGLHGTVPPPQFGFGPPPPMYAPRDDFLVKIAYGRTFGTSTQLDYATLEVSKSLRKFPAFTLWGPAIGEVQVALLGSYVFYQEGTIERVKRLQFENGIEFGFIPKGRYTFVPGPLGISSYLESGAGIGYVSETYRNSGSRWNWSLLAGFGVERCLPTGGHFSIGVQWRHLSNGNMWGEGDELHNSNSGTDMIQGLASIVHRF